MKKVLLAVLLVAVMVISIAATMLTGANESEVYSGTRPDQLAELLKTKDVILETTPNLGIFTDFEIPEGRTLTVRSTLNVSRGATLLINGTLIVAEGARINNQGGATPGTIRVAPGGTMINNGHVENVTASTFIYCGTLINNSANFQVRADAFLIACGVLEANTPLSIHRNARTDLECEECEDEPPPPPPPQELKYVIDQSGVVFDGTDFVVPAGVSEFMYIHVVDGPRARVMMATLGEEAEWEYNRIAQPTWLDIIISTINEEDVDKASTVLDEIRIDRNVPAFGAGLQRLPNRTRVVITVVVTPDDGEGIDGLFFALEELDLEEPDELEDEDEDGFEENVEVEVEADNGDDDGYESEPVYGDE